MYVIGYNLLSEATSRAFDRKYKNARYNIGIKYIALSRQKIAHRKCQLTYELLSLKRRKSLVSMSLESSESTGVVNFDLDSLYYSI